MTSDRGPRHPGMLTACALLVLIAGASSQRPAIAGLLDQYDRGEFTAVAATIAALPQPPRPWPAVGAEPTEPVYREFAAQAPRWLAAAGPESAPRRRLVAAALALELAHPRRPIAWAFRYPFLVWACDELRRAPTRLAGERWWHLGAIAVMEDALDWTHVLGDGKVPPVPGLPPSARRRFFNRADQLEFTEGHAAHARAAFPDEPRLLLPDAHFAESLTWLSTYGPSGINSQQTSPALLESMDRMLRQRFNANPDEKALDPKSMQAILDRANLIPKAVDQYAALAHHDALRAEAELRQGFLALRFEAWDEALAHLDAVPPAAEPVVVSLTQLFRGWIFEQTDRTRDAIDAYRRALAAAPLARTASILLAAQLTLVGQQQEAYALLDAALKANPGSPQYLPDRAEGLIDPWTRYRRGEAVMLATHLARLREALQ